MMLWGAGRLNLAGYSAAITALLACADLASAQQRPVQIGDAASNVVPIVISAKARPTLSPEQCFPVTEIVVQGEHDILARDKIIEKIEPLAVPCQGNESVGALLKELNGLYAAAGYVTTQGFLAPQDIAKTGKLVIQVVPGRIGEVRYSEEHEPYRWFLPRMAVRSREFFQATGPFDVLTRTAKWYDALDDELDRLTLLPPSVRIRMAQTVKPGEVLHVDPLQDTIDALNSVPSHKAAAELAPGKAPATSDIVIKNRVKDSFRAYAGYDTESVEGVDRLRFGTTMEKDNLIGVNDIWSLTLRSGTSTNDLSGSVAVPYGNVTARASAGWQESTTDLSGLAELFVTTWNVSGGADWVVLRDKVSKTVLDVTLAHREQNRYINGFALEEQRVTYIAGGAAYSRSFERGSISGRLGGAVGLPIFSAVKDSDDIDDAAPRSQFWKLEGSVSAGYVIPGLASFSTNWVGQYTTQALYNDDQITLGSRATVRGYSSGSFAADMGFYARNEIAFAVPVGKVITAKSPAADWGRATFEHLNPYVFLDGGMGRDNANDLDGYRLSTGLGIRYGGPRLSYDVGYAFRLAEDKVTPVDDADGELFINLRMKLF